jgi:hypothetical protein
MSNKVATFTIADPIPLFTFSSHWKIANSSSESFTSMGDASFSRKYKALMTHSKETRNKICQLKLHDWRGNQYTPTGILYSPLHFTG